MFRETEKESPIMPAFLVHGVPDTHHLWDGVCSHLSRADIIAPDMPGFGRDVPGGFGSTKEEYVNWLISEVENVGEPVDIVGHDWGALLVERFVCLRSDLVRTWAAGAGVIDETYVWHPVAQMWQTPGVGENVMQAMTVDAMVPAFVNDGMPEPIAKEFAARVDDRMKAAILPLYRSATSIGNEWGPALDGVKKSGLVICGEKDQYMSPGFHRRLAARTGAELITLPGGHWWPAQFPKETAQALERLWANA
jgi:pimeloyl-ACP methyl ester carboxylesterase